MSIQFDSIRNKLHFPIKFASFATSAAAAYMQGLEEYTKKNLVSFWESEKASEKKTILEKAILSLPIAKERPQ